MELIIGGAYQGKKEYVQNKFGIKKEDIFLCERDFGNVNWDSPCIAQVEEYVYWSVMNHKNALEEVKKQREHWQNHVFICQDIFCGVVPMEATNRKWREETGKLCHYLSGQADTVVRIYCGLEQKLK